MSIRALNWAWELRLEPSPKVVALALGDEADDAGYCFPSVRHIADKCCLTERTVQRMLRLLEMLGYITVEVRFRKDGSRTSNGYRLTFAPVTNCHPPPGAAVSGPGDRGLTDPPSQPSPRGDTRVGVTTTYPRVDPKSPPPNQQSETCDGGGRLYFPNALSKAHQDAVGAQVAGLSNEQAQQILDELAGRLNTSQIRNPVRYCAELVKRLRCGQFSRELGIQVAARREAEKRHKAQLLAEADAARETHEPAANALPEHFRALLERIKQGPAPARSSGECGDEARKDEPPPSNTV